MESKMFFWPDMYRACLHCFVLSVHRGSHLSWELEVIHREGALNTSYPLFPYPLQCLQGFVLQGFFILKLQCKTTFD